MILRRLPVLVAIGAATAAITIFACSSFDSAPGSEPANDGGAESSANADGTAPDPPTDAGTTTPSFCDGHTYCWTFDEADASVSTTALTIEDGGVDGTKCLVGRFTNEPASALSKALYTSFTLVPPPQDHLRMECAIRVDSLGPADDAGHASMSACSISNEETFGVMAVERSGGKIQIHTYASSTVDAGVAAISCHAAVLEPSGWTRGIFDITWLADGGAHVVVTAGTDSVTCDGFLPRGPANMKVQPGINGTYGDPTAPGTFQLGLDNVAIDVK